MRPWLDLANQLVNIGLGLSVVGEPHPLSPLDDEICPTSSWHVAAVHLAENRQAEAEAMLREDFGLDIIRNIADLDLQTTPSLCEAANDYITQYVVAYRHGVRTRSLSVVSGP